MAKRKFLNEGELKEIAENVNISDEEHEDYSSDDSINDPNYSPSLNANEENLQQFLQDLESGETRENIENNEILECEFYEFSDVQWNAYEESMPGAITPPVPWEST
ncbi:hypothetical protein CBL_09916 [Carabus blaptoides fortunei]